MYQESQRVAYGEALVELGRHNESVVVLEADLGKSTMSIMFQEAFPERYFEMDGHNVAEILDTLDKADTIKGKPVVLIAQTIKGKGVDFAENTAAFHNGILTQEQYESALRQTSL